MKSPKWKEEELKLALELYLSKNIEWLSKMKDDTPEIQMLSLLLNELDLYEESDIYNFRSPGSIRMKLTNLRSLDSDSEIKSLVHIGESDRVIWEKYHDKFGDLKKECKNIVKEHYTGGHKNELAEFLKRYETEEYDVESEFIEYTKQVYKQVNEFRKQAVLLEDLESSQKIVTSCYDLMNSIKWCVEIQDQHSGYNKNVIEKYSEHGGINQIPVKNCEEKIGKYVQRKMKELFDREVIDDKEINDLMNEQWCRTTFHLGNPFMKVINTQKSLSEQLRDINGHQRYWHTIYEYRGTSYCLCKEWYEKNRKYFDIWLNKINHSKNPCHNERQFVEFLEVLAKLDQNQISVNKNQLLEHFNYELNIEDIFQYLKELDVLTIFGEEENEVVIEDYDVLYDMINNPQKYIH